MSFKHEKTIFLDANLCSVEIFSPSQMNNPDDAFQLMASTWFGTTSEEIPTADGMQLLTYGLHSATLEIETCERSRMQSAGRYRSVALTLLYEGLKDEVAKNGREASVDGGFSIPFLKMFSASAQGKVSTAKNEADTSKKHQKTTFEVFETDTASPKTWRIRAINPARPTPHLNGAEMRDVELCTIATPEGEAIVSAKILISAQDLWLAGTSSSGTASLADNANQNAVLLILGGKSAEQQASNVFGPDQNIEIVQIAQSTLHRQNGEED